MKIRVALACVGLFAATSVFAGAEERKFIHDGMSEGEVMMKIGRPDSESTDSGGGSKVTVKRWIYMPTQGDPQTVTTIVIRDGKVVEVSRQMSR